MAGSENQLLIIPTGSRKKKTTRLSTELTIRPTKGIIRKLLRQESYQSISGNNLEKNSPEAGCGQFC